MFDAVVVVVLVFAVGVIAAGGWVLLMGRVNDVHNYEMDTRQPEPRWYVVLEADRLPDSSPTSRTELPTRNKRVA